MATQATAAANSLSLAPEQVNGAGTQAVQVQQPQVQQAPSGIAGNGQSTMAPVNDERVEPVQTATAFAGNQPSLPVTELMTVLMALASERTTPWLPAEQQLKSFGFQPSVAQMVLLKRIREAQALSARVLQGSPETPKPEEKATNNKS